MTDTVLLERESTNVIIGAFYDVYNTLGFGFLENVCTLALERELLARGRIVGREVPIPINYKGDFLTHYRADIIVDEKVVVEVKATDIIPPYTRRQVTNYPRATKLEVALKNQSWFRGNSRLKFVGFRKRTRAQLSRRRGEGRSRSGLARRYVLARAIQRVLER